MLNPHLEPSLVMESKLAESRMLHLFLLTLLVEDAEKVEDCDFLEHYLIGIGSFSILNYHFLKSIP